MKYLFIIVAIILMASISWAAPFVVCDPYPTTVIQPTFFNVIMDGGAPIQSLPEVVTGNAVRLHYDLAALSTGAHTMTVAACNEWGCSSTVPFPFTKAVPTVPSGTKLSPN